jgi:hypothetical protein
MGVIITLILFALCIGAVVGYLGWKFKASSESTPPTASNPGAVTPVPTKPVSVMAPVPAEAPVSTPAPKKPEANIPPTAATPKTVIAPSAKSGAPSASGESVQGGPAPLSNSSSPVSTTVAPGVTAKTGVNMSVSNASPAFRSFVANAKITGVFQGRDPRAVINGKVTHVGGLVDHTLGVVFHSIDPQRKHIIFMDKTGAIATRKY